MDIAELLELEHRGWSSLCDGTGADFYGRRMTADAVMVLAHGLALDREAVIASLNEAPPWQSYDISDERLIEVDENTAALVYTGRTSRGDEDHFHALMSTVYTRREGQWRIALYQQTPVPPAAQ
ncbi:nuclear transport factor 2 family protein [Dietzia sp. SLG510A3-30A2]|nr:nuclear transport factor 2 family protein [Dietzia sp. SLG510A3-30A2]